MPSWLWRTICSVVATIALMAVAQWANCAFIVAPRAWPLYGATQAQNARSTKAASVPRAEQICGGLMAL